MSRSRTRLIGAAVAAGGHGALAQQVIGAGGQIQQIPPAPAAARSQPDLRFERPASAAAPAQAGADGAVTIAVIKGRAALSLHRVIRGAPSERRRERLQSASPLDRRISYGCINVPAAFFDRVVKPAFTGAGGVICILPETGPLEIDFPES